MCDVGKLAEYISLAQHLHPISSNFAIVLRTPTLRAGSQFRNSQSEILLTVLPYTPCPMLYAFSLKDLGFASLVLEEINHLFDELNLRHPR